MPEPEKVAVKEKLPEEASIRIKADKIEVEVFSKTRGVMTCLLIAEKVIKAFKEDKNRRMCYEGVSFGKETKDESRKDLPNNTG